MRAGPLRQRVSVFKPVASNRNEFGEPNVSSVNMTRRWASIAPLQGNELMVAQQVNGKVTHEVTMRDLSDMDLQNNMWLEFNDGRNNRKLEIVSFMNTNERRREVKLMCAEAK